MKMSIHRMLKPLILVLGAMLSLRSAAQEPDRSISADPQLEQFFEALFKGEDRMSFDEATASVKEYESVYLELKSTEGTSDAICREVLKAQGFLVWSSNSGMESLLMPSLLDEHAAECELASSYLDFIFGCGLYDQGRFTTAIELFERVLRYQELAPQLELMTRLNLASSYNAVEQPMKSIELLEGLLERAKSKDYRGEVSDEWLLNVAVNLGAIHVTSGSYALAKKQFQAIDRSAISEYWSRIIDYNLLIVHLGLGDREAIEGVWRTEFRNVDLAEFPPTMYESLMTAALVMEDFLFFERFREYLLSLPHLDMSGSAHAALFANDLSGDELKEEWMHHVQWENDYFGFLKRRSMDLAHVTDVRITKLLEELTEAREMNRLLNHVIQWSLTCLAIAAIGVVFRFFLLRRRKESEWRRAFLREPASSFDAKEEEVFQINEDDVRLLGDAVTFGKRTSEAMLILRKLNASIRNDMDALEVEELKLLDPSDLLNSNDLKVLSYLAAGFDPKEVARVMGLTVPTVYNISSRIRGKLDIPKEEKLREWVHAEVRKRKQGAVSG